MDSGIDNQVSNYYDLLYFVLLGVIDNVLFDSLCFLRVFLSYSPFALSSGYDNGL